MLKKVFCQKQIWAKESLKEKMLQMNLNSYKNRNIKRIQNKSGFLTRAQKGEKMSYKLHHLKLCFPFIARDMIGYKEVNSFDMVITLNDGSKVLYDDFNKTYRMLPNDISNMSEDECKQEFAYRLKSRMQRRCITQQKLSEMTGIPQGTISRYMDGTNVPSFYKADKIAKALGCSVDDFRYY